MVKLWTDQAMGARLSAACELVGLREATQDSVLISDGASNGMNERAPVNTPNFRKELSFCGTGFCPIDPEIPERCYPFRVATR